MKFDVKELKADGLVQYTTEDERWYRRGDLSVPSVSWISGYWPKGKGFENFLKNKGQEADEVRDHAAERGSKIHQAIDKLLSDGRLSHDDTFLNTFTDRLEELNASEYGAVLTFVEFCREIKPKIIFNEKVVFNEVDGYAGTLDIFCKIGDEFWLIDIKTGKSIYMSHRLQLAAYKRCLVGDVKLAILQVGYITKKGWKLTEIEDEYPMFELAHQIWKRENNGERPNQVTYPQQINMEAIWVSNNQKAEKTSSELPTANSSAISTEKTSPKLPTPDGSEPSSASPTNTRVKKSRKSNSRSKTTKRKSRSNSHSKRGSQSDSSSASPA